MKIVHRSALDWWGTDPSATPCVSQTDNQTCAYGEETANSFGTAAIGTERDPGYYQVDSSLFKDFSITEGQKLGFRLDAFNVLNVADLGSQQQCQQLQFRPDQYRAQPGEKTAAGAELQVLADFLLFGN